ncbi:MAG TPA: TonB-dependent receptor plug domain-containing protein, partial [Gemmatimonadaceae bacterium]|nr:TonB-dependent receptor plug domain-containing protein [Gemmatimonadaceae bacterium]
MAPSGAAAQWTSPLDRRITIHAAQLSLRDALDRVAASAKLRLSYSAELLPLDRAVCVSAEAMPAGQVLSNLLSNVNVAAVVAGADQVVLAPRSPAHPFSDSAQTPHATRSPELLDRVVVTGSAIGAPERELTVGLDVVNGQQLSRENSTTLSNALDGYVPGVWSWAQSPSSMVTSYASIRGASSFGLSYPKIYIDGIEVANPLLVTRFAPETIDRIEVIRGPQGSALYGTDAISGVVNIVTRHDGSDVDGEHASLRTSAGVTQSAFAHDVLAQEHALSFVSGSSTQSFDFNLAASSTGDFIPNGYSRDVLASAGTRIVGERATFTGTARFFTEQAGAATSPLLSAVSPNDSGPGGIASHSIAPTASPQSIHEYTVGSSMTLASNDRWTHTFLVGLDGYRLANVETSFTAIPSVADSALRAAQGGADRATIRASSVLQLAGGEPTHATLTFSGEQAVLREVSEVASADPLMPSTVRMPAPQTNTYSNLTTWQNSTGLTAQA